MTAKQFARLKPANRRIVIAQDVLATLAKPKHFKVTRGTYCTFTMPHRNDDKNDIFTADAQLQDFLVPKIEQHCQACAMGALLLSHVRLFNAVQLSDIDGFGYKDAKSSVASDDKPIIAILSDYFSHEALRTIEAAFEGGAVMTVSGMHAISDGDGGGIDFLASEWFRLIPDNTKRLQAICKNIVKNKGDFDITQLPKPTRKKAA